jgi:hypothetical protein
MATTCTSCGCNQIECGCKDSYLTSPPPCPTPEGCPEAQPCSEIFDAQCVVYTGPNLQCGLDNVILTNTALNLALEDIVTYFCQEVGALPTYDVVAGQGISVTETTLGTATTFTVTNNGIKKYTNSAMFIPATPTSVVHNLNTTFITLSIVTSSGLPYTAYVHGTDYTYTVVDSNTVSVTLTPGGAANVTIIG